jgi:sucrose phosphorylase
MLDLASLVEARGGNVNRIMSSAHAAEVDVHQLNCTYFSALDCDDDRYFAARAIQLFARGVPQVYYVGLLAGANDSAGVELIGDGRAINRHNYTLAEIDEALRRPVVQRLLELVRLRNSHPAFDGTLEVGSRGRSRLRMSWLAGSSTCVLEVDLSSGRVTIDEGLPGGAVEARVG